MFQDFSMTIFLRQTWRDIRLSFAHLNNASSIAMDARMVQSIWVPDLFFPNEKKSHFHDVTVPNRLLRIYNNGTVFYSARLATFLVVYIFWSTWFKFFSKERFIILSVHWLGFLYIFGMLLSRLSFFICLLVLLLSSSA